MAGVTVRMATEGDLEGIVAIYNHYVTHTAITFDTTPWSVDTRRAWLAQFNSAVPRHRLFVAEDGRGLLGYAYTGGFRARAAYDTTVEATVYVRPDARREGLGRALYERAFDGLQALGVHNVMAGVTLPNPASLSLHTSLGFSQCGVMREVGYKRGRYWDVAWLQRLL